MNNLAIILQLTGITIPKGSNSFDMFYSTSLLVIEQCCADVSSLGMRVSVSLEVSYSRPKTFTMIQLLATLSSCATSIRLVLFDAQLHKLKLALDIICLVLWYIALWHYPHTHSVECILLLVSHKN